MGLRQVPSRLDPELRGFLQDLRNEVGRIGGDSFKYVLLGDMRTALSSDFLQPGDISRIVDEAQDRIRDDPFWQFLGDKINLIDGPPTLPGSIQARLDTAQETVENLMAAADAQLQTAIDANGSAIVTLQTVTAGQATQITSLGSRLGTAESKVSMLMSATPTDALWWTGLSTDVDNTKNSVAMLMSTTPDGALWWTGLKSQADASTSNVSMLMSSTPTGASWWAGLSTDTANSKSNIAMLMSTTPTGAQWWSGLKTQVDGNSSQINILNTTTATQGQSIQQISNKTNGNTASIEVLQTVNNGLTAQYSVKLDVNGRVVGFGLYNQPSGSAFYVRADKFAVGDPSTGDRIPFIVSGGNVYIDTAFIINASIDSAKIADAAINNAKIADAAISAAKIGQAQIDTLRVAGNAVTTMAFASSGGGYTNGWINLPNGTQGVFLLGIAGVSESGGVHPVQANFVLKFNGWEIANGGNSIHEGWGQGIVQNAWLGGLGGGYYGFEAYTYDGGGAGHLYQWSVSVVCIALMR